MAYDTDNIFAKILRGELPAHVVHEDERTVAILDVMPQADGHTLILPRAPAEDFFTLTDADAAAVMRAGRVVAEALRKAFDADGIRVMQFNGEAAGQTVFHYHLHLIPCHLDQGLRGHARGMADPDALAGHAERIRAALSRG
jgi:histidine triad (HIT) family protein